MSWEVYTFGGGDYLFHVFNGIAALTKGGAYLNVLALTAMLGLTWAMLESAFGNSFRPNITWAVSFFLFYNLMFAPKTTVLIHDELNRDRPYQAIENVPFALGVFASLTSRVGHEITQQMETAFAPVDYLPYHQHGMLFESSLVDIVSSMKIVDEKFAASINSFMHQCVFYDILLHRYSLDDLKSTENIWGFLLAAGRPSKARSFQITNASGRKIVTCAEGIKELDNQWKEQIDKTTTMLDKVFGHQNDHKVLFLQHLPVSYSGITNLSKNASDLIKQNMLINAFDRAGTDFSTQGGNIYTTVRANIQTRAAFEASKKQAQDWVPILRIVFEVMFYGAFPLVFLLFLLPIGPQVARGYFITFVWLQSWGPLYAILNLIMTGYTHYKVSAFNGYGLSIMTQAGITAIHHNAAEMAGYLSWFIPFIAAGIAKGTVAVTGLSTSMLAIPQSAASTAASEAASGNISLGNMSMDNSNYGNSSANKINTSAFFDNGRVQALNSSGGMTTVTEDGRIVYDQTGSVSRIPNVQLSSNDTGVNSYMQSASMYESMGQNLSAQAANAKVKSIDQLAQSMYNHSINQNNGIRFTEHASQETRDAYSRIQQVAEEVSKTHGIDVAKAFEMALRGNIGLSGSIGKAAPGGATANFSSGLEGSSSFSSNTTRSLSYNQIERDFKYDQLSNDINTITSAVKDRSIELSDTSGRSLNESFNQHYSESQRFEDQSRIYMDTARNFTQQAQFMKSQSISFTQDMMPAFVEFSKSHRGLDGNPLEERALSILANDPIQTARLKEAFLESHGAHQLQNSFRHNKDALEIHSGSKLTSEYKSAALDIGKDIGDFDNSPVRQDFLSHTQDQAINNQDLISSTGDKLHSITPGVNQMPIKDIKQQVQEKLDGNIIATNIKSTFLNE